MINAKKFFIFGSVELEPDFLSKSIMQKIGADFSHVGIIEVGHDDIERIFHATGEGFNQKLVSEFLIDHVFIHKIEVPVENPGFASGWLRGNIGKDYSESQFAGFIKERFKKLVSDGKRELICSEATTRFLMECSTLQYDENPDFVDPKQAIELAKKVGMV